MNKAELITKVSAQSGVDSEACRKVIDALEQVFEEELSDSTASRVIRDLCKLLKIQTI